MTDKEYNHLVELRNKCYRDRMDRETEINYFTGFNDCYEKVRETLEKENAELKKENKVLAQNLEDTEILNKTYEKKLNDLKKENAELTKDMASAVPLLEKATVISDLLNKAKDLIKWFVWYFREDYNNVPYKQKVKEAEQFLSEVEK